MIKKILLIFGFLSLFAIGFSQDVSFSQINSSVLYLNPAFAGSRKCPELSMTYRNHWPSLGSQYVTSVVTYEQYIRDLKSGFGILMMNDRSANGIYSLNSFNTYYSNQQKLTNNLNIKFGLEFSYKQNFIDSKKLFFEDSFNGVAFTNYTNESFLNNFKVNYFDVGTGILLFNHKWFAGFSVSHINQPNQTLIYGESYLPVKYNIHGGVIIPLDKSTDRNEDVTYTPSISILRQGQFTQLTLNNNIRKGKFLFGGGLRLVEGYSYRDALLLNMGVDTGELMFFYNYDVTISQLGPTTGGAHEISVVIKINNKTSEKKITVPSCSFQ